MKNTNAIKMAETVIKIGVNLQKDQLLVINAPIECASFVHALSKAAFNQGAKDVMVNYNDEVLSRIRYDNANVEALTTIPQWISDKFQYYLKEGIAVVSVYANDPEVLKGADASKIQAASNAMSAAIEDYHFAISSSQLRWCVVSVPTKGWAKKVFPDLAEAEAVDKLWETIFKTTRTDLDDPIAAWTQHNKNLHEKMNYLNSQQFETLRYKSANGTDISVGMPENHEWAGGNELASDGLEFFANIPTEEVFSAPHKDKVNGKLVASYPLVYQGQLIDDFWISFKDGVVSDFDAKTGLDALTSLVNANPGSNQLGEIALVPFNSPISDLNILFYNTLFDENASCHFALGSAYPMCLQGGQKMSKESLAQAGLNYSRTHVDFMVGTKDLSIMGIKSDGSELPIFVDGNWAF